LTIGMMKSGWRRGRIGWMFGLVMGLALSGCGRSPEPREQADRTVTAGITVIYAPATKPFNRVMRRLLRRSGRLERLARIWRSSVPGLMPVTIEVGDCANPDVGLARPGHILLCYDLLGYLDNAFRDLSGSPIERESGVLDGMSLWLTREVARSQGEVQDAKHPANTHSAHTNPAHTNSANLDRQTLALLSQGEGPSMAMAGVQWLYSQGKPEPIVMLLPYWQANGFGVEQYDRLVCAIYRRDPGRFPFLAAEYGRERLDRCGAKKS
jgi:hypothetical protein